jgi:hypothetical protein
MNETRYTFHKYYTMKELEYIFGLVSFSLIVHFTPEDGLNIFEFFQSAVFVKRITCVLEFLSSIENVSPGTFTIVLQCHKM